VPKIISCDLAIVGGGLAGALIALALKRRRPDLDLRLIEGAERIGGNHLWSFFASDVLPAHRWIVSPLIGHTWRGYDVRFPGQARTLTTPYYSIESDRLDRLVRENLPEDAVMTSAKVLGVGARAAVLANGDRVEAKGLIDARGAGDLSLLDLGWQKFLGRELALSAPHTDERPVVMDATVPQIDGYRFVYTLPFTPMRMFVEDTYYSDTPELDEAVLAKRIDGYVADRGWRVDRVVREEAGVLPVAMGGDFEGYWRSGGARIAKAGMRAGLFHPTTGYSLPDAVRLAAAIADASDLSSEALHGLTYGHARAAWRSRMFYRLLDRMMFRAAEPQERYRILARFYRLDAELIGRFYAARSTLADQARLLAGKPPVPIGRAVKALLGI
jgi:lycopene beta-cyclase